jgi:lambda repressor-like predicted transcriptional regulator
MRIDRVKLIAEMARQEITVNELAKKACVSQVTITAARGGKSCSRNSALHIARGLGVDVSELLPEED